MRELNKYRQVVNNHDELHIKQTKEQAMKDIRQSEHRNYIQYEFLIKRMAKLKEQIITI